MLSLAGVASVTEAILEHYPVAAAQTGERQTCSANEKDYQELHTERA